MQKYLVLVTIGILVSIAHQSIAQLGDYTFGKITQKEVDMEFYEKDPGAVAVILFDKGDSKFVKYETGNYRGFNIQFTRTKRIKIFKKEGYDLGDIEVWYYTDGYGKTEVVKDIRAYSYNYENSVPIKMELVKKDIFTEKVNDRWNKKVFAIPNVKEGSIIEYTYILETPFKFNLPDWEFQNFIPTIYSEYQVSMIPFYEYKFILQGINKFDYQNSFVSKSVERQFFSATFQDYVHQYVLKDVPAFNDESYITSRNDYIIKMDFQLAKQYRLNGTDVEYMTTWTKLNNDILKYDTFGKYLSSCQKISEKNINDELNLSAASPAIKIKSIIDYVKKNYSWNGRYRKLASQKPKELVSSKKGSSADLNLFLVGLLRANGIEANPVLISTRDHGRVHRQHAFESFLNSVVVLIKIGDGFILTDATDRLIPYNKIPANCLNGLGLVVSKDTEGWVNLSDITTSVLNEKLRLKILPDEEIIQGDFVQESTGYDGRMARGKFDNQTTKVVSYYSDQGYVNPENVRLLNYQRTHLPHFVIFKANYPIEVYGDLIAISPFLNLPMSDNKLKAADRKHPVDMVYKKRRGYSCNVEIPEGYVVSSLPKNYSVEDELIKIDYQLTQDGKVITVEGLIDYKKSIYEPNEYARLKEHFSKIVKQFNESIVFKKS